MLKDLEAEFGSSASSPSPQTTNNDANVTVTDTPTPVRPRSTIKVLVPGAGLGRLVFDLCLAGYQAEGNEISYHALLASSWVLNHTSRPEEWEVFPFALGFSNHVSREAQVRGVRVPDVCPRLALQGARDGGEGGEGGGQEAQKSGEMSMTAADFVVLYGDQEHASLYDAVTTVYFIDTAPNLLRYIETVRHCLMDGGVWVNLGPLLWHFEESGPIGKTAGGGKTGADDHDGDWVDTAENGGKRKREREREGIGEPGSVELTDEEVVSLLGRMGFVIERHEVRAAETGYIQDPESMLQSRYRVSHWVARKVS